jgi:hypothetical protein
MATASIGSGSRRSPQETQTRNPEGFRAFLRHVGPSGTGHRASRPGPGPTHFLLHLITNASPDCNMRVQLATNQSRMSTRIQFLNREN